MGVQSHFIFWSAAFAALMVLVFFLKAILLPFVLGIAIAYLLNPAVGKLGCAGVSRGPASLLILFGFLVVTTVFLAALIPILYKELVALSGDLPLYADRIWALLKPLSKQVQALIGAENGSDLKDLLSEHLNTALNVTRRVAEGLVAGGQAALDVMALMVFTPVVAYFMMKEWPSITQWVVDLMPRDHKNTILDLFRQIDVKLSGFVRGQISVAVILGLVYALALSLIGLKYGFLIGFMSGILSIIPMVGSAVGLVVGVLVAWFQASDWMFVLMVAGIFLVGQFIEGNFLTPRLVGKTVGLHPLWVFFALLAGGSLFGILGMFLAVPVVAAGGVLVGFAIKQYKASPYYKGTQNKKLKRKNDSKSASNTA